MFLGHYAIALAAKKAAPRVSLGTLFLSAQLLDLFWPLFVLIGLESVRIDPGNTAMTPLDFSFYPYTHSLAAAVLWSLALGFCYYGIRKETMSAFIVGGVVLSHWVLDFISHRPDLPLAFSGGPYFGLGLWNSLAGTLIFEGGIYLGGIIFYARTTRARDRIGSVGFWSLVGLLGLIYAGNILGPPPPNVEAVAISGIASWLFVLWAYWVDKHRTVLAR